MFLPFDDELMYHEGVERMFITGTTAYGPHTDDSDIDIVMYKSDIQKLTNILQKSGIRVESDTISEYENPTLYFRLLPDLPKINIIIVHDMKEFNSWKYATQKMIERNSIKNREERIEMFSIYRNDYLSWYKK